MYNIIFFFFLELILILLFNSNITNIIIHTNIISLISICSSSELAIGINFKRYGISATLKREYYIQGYINIISLMMNRKFTYIVLSILT